MSGPPSLEGLGAPAGVVAAIGRLHEELAGAAGANLAGLILSGGLAQGVTGRGGAMSTWSCSCTMRQRHRSPLSLRRCRPPGGPCG